MTRLEIEAFLAVIKYGSISSAAEKLYVTQPALSRRIRAVEEELGYRLLVRSKGVRSIELTEEGQAFIGVAEKLAYVYREACAISNLKQNPVLNVASVGSVSTYLLPNVLKKLVDGEVKCNLCFHNYHSYEAYGYVESGLVDVALISDDMYAKNVVTSPAFQSPFVVIGGPARSGALSIHPTDLKPEHEIRLPWNPEFDAWHERWFDVTVYPKVRLDQMSLLEEFLTDEHFAVVPALVAGKIRGGRLPFCRLEDGPPDEIIYYLTSGNKKGDMVERFLSLLQEELTSVNGVRSFLGSSS